MKKFAVAAPFLGLAALVLGTVAVPSASAAGLTLHDIDGQAYLMAKDGTYLGKVSSASSDSESICASWAQYGGSWSDKSIRASWAQYGGSWSDMGAYSTWTTTPPAIVYQGSVIGYVTKNTSLAGAVDPDVLFATYHCKA
jgi:hypothetical protein